MSAPTEVGTLAFTHVNAPGYTFEFSTFGLNIFSGIGTNVNPPTFNLTGAGKLNFINASAGNAIINITASGGGSPTEFFGTSTAANATITLNNGSFLNFWDSSKAGNATITTNDGSTTFFHGNSSADNATIIANAGGLIQFNVFNPGEKSS